MAKKTRYKKPPLSTVSTVPVFFLDRQTVEEFNLVRIELPERLDRGRQLFLLGMAEILRREVQARAPKIKIGSEEMDYAKDLKIAIVDGVKDADAVAVYFEASTTKLTVKRIEETVLFFRPVQDSPEWVDVLRLYGPWPAFMVPVVVEEGDAKVISRKARQDEVQEFADRIWERRSEIETKLERAGADNPQIESTDKAVGIVVLEDVGYNVLRKEFGFDGEKQEAHWRPALNALKDEAPLVMEQMIRYLLTGQEAVFQLSGDYVDISVTNFKQGIKFQNELAPFVPTG